MIFSILLTLYFLMSAADNFWKQFGPKSGPTKLRPVFSRSDLDSNCLTLMVFLEEFFKKVYFEKKSADKKHEKLPSRERVKTMRFFAK